jgi:hypothetical protein
MRHEQCDVVIPVDKNIQYIVKYILTEYAHRLIPFGSCEGDIDEEEYQSAYIGLIVKDLDMMDKFFSEIFGDVPNAIIHYSNFNGVRQYIIRWNASNTEHCNNIAKNRLGYEED